MDEFGINLDFLNPNLDKIYIQVLGIKKTSDAGRMA